jgi:pilus assembly protein TadC
VGRLLRLGAEPAAGWATLTEVGCYRSVAVAGQRCADSGARLAGALRAGAAELRAQRRDAAVAKAERVGIWSLLPLGLCFLPAFVCIGVVPVVIGVASPILSRAGP